MSRRSVPLDRLASLPPGTQGLSAAQVERQRSHGFNDIVAPATDGWLVVARDTARDPMLWFLLLSAGLFGLLGQVTESLTLLVAMAPLLGMDAYLHRRTSASAAGLASRLASSAKVLRDGQWRHMPSRELVPGDLVEVAPGEHFPADGVLVAGTGLQADESTLTGESLPVAKRALGAAAPLPASVPDEHWGTAGTRLLTGTARLLIVFIGGETRFGEIARSATEGRFLCSADCCICGPCMRPTGHWWRWPSPLRPRSPSGWPRGSIGIRTEGRPDLAHRQPGSMHEALTRPSRGSHAALRASGARTTHPCRTDWYRLRAGSAMSRSSPRQPPLMQQGRRPAPS